LKKIVLEPTESYWDYWCDPINVETFAATGMGGAHFGEFEAEDGKRPVVLVAPDFDEPCIILGDSLFEFLCLGCEVGYGLLVELPCQMGWTVEQIESRRPCVGDPQEQRILSELRSRFRLKAWHDVGNRLFDLQHLYLDQLEMPRSYSSSRVRSRLIR
jgi:hypothetical protein